MADLYDKLTPNKLEENPAKDEIIQLLRKYEKVTADIDREAARLRGITGTEEAIARMNKLRKRADKSIEAIKQSAANWAKIAAPKSYLSGQALADSYIKRQSKIITEDGEEIKILDLKPKDKQILQKLINQVAAETLRDVNLINDSWRKRFDDVIRKGIKDTRGIKLIKQPGIRGGTTTGKEIGSRLYQQIKNEGLKLIDKAGRRWTPERYIRMYSRTRTRELQTQGIENRMGDYDLDLVKISEHVDVDGMDICNEYEGRIFSLSGDHPDYPKLDVHCPFHPNCAHVQTPWVEKYHQTKEELNNQGKEEINKPPEYNLDYKKLYPGLSDEALEGLERTHNEVSRKGKETGTEYLAAIFKNDGRKAYDTLGGDESSVGFPPKLINYLNNADKNSIIMVHNHPGSSSFSDDDLHILNAFSSIDSMTVEGHNKTKYICRIANGKTASKEKIYKLYEKHREKTFGKIREMVHSGKISTDDAWKEHSHKILEGISKEMGWKYKRVISDD